MLIKFDIRLTGKNLLTLVGAVAVFGETLIALLVPADHLGWLRWRVAVILIAAIGISALVWQTLKQSCEDHDRDIREQERDAKIHGIEEHVKRIAAGTNSLPVSVESESPKLATLPKADSVFDGELQRIFVYPRTGIVPLQLLQEIRRAAGRVDETKVDSDLLAKFYIVNCTDSVHYIRDITGSVEVTGVRKQFIRQGGFTAPVFNESVEYGWDENEDNAERPTPLPALLPQVPLKLEAREPIHGWVRFLLADVNPDAINAQTWQFTIVDSLGNEYPITKTASAESVPKKGTIGLRRAS